MAKYIVSFAYYKLDDKGKPKGKTSTQKTIEAESDLAVMEIIKSQYPGNEIEFRKIIVK